MITDRIGRHEVLSLISNKNYFFRAKKNSLAMKERETLYWKTGEGWFKLQPFMRLVDLNYNFECDWFIKLFDNNLASELVEDKSFS